MSFLDANLGALEKRLPTLARELRLLKDHGSPLEIFTAKSGLPTAKFRGQSLYSSYDPLGESLKLITRQCDWDSAPDYAVLGGWGLGYHAQILLEKWPQVPLLVVEPSLPCFLQSLEARDMTRVLAHETLSFCLGAAPQAVQSFQDLFVRHRWFYLPLHGLAAAEGEYFQALQGEMEGFRNLKVINQRTLYRFSSLWAHNFFTNVSQNLPYRPVQELTGLCPGCPAVLAAAGPSLHQSLPLLKQHREKFILIAVDTAWRALKRENIIPDILVSMDGQYWNSRHLDGGISPQTVLISEFISHPRIHRLAPLQHWISGCSAPLIRDFENQLPCPPLPLGSGGSVATTAWEVAFLLGCGPLILCGLDLGFPQGETHTRGSLFEERQAGTAHRFLPSETSALGLRTDGGRLSRKSNAGGRIETDQRMEVYRRWFEQQRALRPEATVWNTSPQGVEIQGIPFAPLPSLLENLTEPVPAWASQLREGFKPQTWDARGSLDRLSEKWRALISDPQLSALEKEWPHWHKLLVKPYIQQFQSFPWTRSAEKEAQMRNEVRGLTEIFSQALDKVKNFPRINA